MPIIENTGEAIYSTSRKYCIVKPSNRKEAKWYFTFIYFLLSFSGFLLGQELLKSLDYFIFIIFLFLFFTKFRQLDQILIIIVIYFVIVSIIGPLVLLKSDNLGSIRYQLIRICTYYFVLKILTVSMFSVYEKVTYYLCLISLPIYFAQVLYTDLFISIAPYLNFLTFGEHLSYGGWSIIVYRFNPFAPLRNCGYMWEPGAFAFTIILAQVIRFQTNGFKIDKHSIIFLITLLTTVSTAGYFALFFIFLCYFYYNRKKQNLLLLLLPFFIYFSINYYGKSDFLSGKVNMNLSTGMEATYIEIGNGGVEKLNRYGYFLYSLLETARWPFGVGTSYYNDVVGAGTISGLLLVLGIPGVLLFLVGIWKFLRMLNISSTFKVNFLLLIALLIVFFSNPFEQSSIMYTFIFLPYIFTKQIYKPQLLV